LVALGALLLAGCEGSAAPVTEVASKPANPRLALPLYEEAVVIKRPVLPARMADGDCPGVDKCEFGTEWRTCEAIPLYREAFDGAPVIRQLKPMEAFLAEAGEIELVAPGRVEVTDMTYPHETGGDYLEKGAVIEVYGPLHDARALYFNPATGKAWSPPANENHWWWEGKNSKMTAVPKMTWWVRAKTKDGTRGWLRLVNTLGTEGFPQFSQAEMMETWDTRRVRDDETPKCNEILSSRDNSND
jgi:hypothetical protein